MKHLLLIILFSPLMLFSQTTWSGLDTLPAGTSSISLPEMKYASGYNGSEYVIQQKEDYYALFHDSMHSKLPAIDFTRYELLGRTQCRQCLQVCEGRPGCHRNACHYSRTWYLLDKQSRLPFHADTLNYSCTIFSYGREEFICRDDSSLDHLKRFCPALSNDTIDLQNNMVLARSVMVDCAASIKHELYLDTLQRCLIWRIFTNDGGCHGMRDRSFVFVMPQVPPGYVIRFEEFSVPELY